MSLRQVRLNLGMSQRELATASTNVLKSLGIERGIPRNLIYRCEIGKPISELSANKLLMTINTLHEWRGRPKLGIDDLTWTISRRKRKEE